MNFKLSSVTAFCLYFCLNSTSYSTELIQGDKVETVPGAPICETKTMIVEFNRRIKSKADVQSYMSLLKSGCFIGDSKIYGLFVKAEGDIYEISANGKKYYTISRGVKYQDIDLVMLEKKFERRFDENYTEEEVLAYEPTKKSQTTQTATTTRVQRQTPLRRYSSDEEMLQFHTSSLNELRRRQREFLRQESGIYDFSDIRTTREVAKQQISRKEVENQQTSLTSTKDSSIVRVKVQPNETLGLLIHGGVDRKAVGECKIVLMDGTLLSGNFSTDSQMNGYGEILFNNGVRLLGEFKNGILDGDGEYIGSEVMAKGQFVNGRLNGLGNVYIRRKKEVISGEFENGVLNGVGKICRVGYKCLVGTFDHGKYVSSLAL